jgi:hypothetical protein
MITFDLPFPYHMHDFDSRDGLLGSFDGLESLHWLYDFLYESMILFNYIVKIFLLSEYCFLIHSFLVLQLLDCGRVSWVFIDRDHAWRLIVW